MESGAFGVRESPAVVAVRMVASVGRTDFATREKIEGQSALFQVPVPNDDPQGTLNPTPVVSLRWRASR